MIGVNYLNNRDRIEGYAPICLLALLFLAIPFAAFVYSLLHFNRKSSQIIIVLFIALFGYNMVAESSEMDLFRYHAILEQYSSLSFNDVINNFFTLSKDRDSIWRTSDESMDVYVGLMSTLLSRITNNGHILMACFGIVYGLAMVKVLEQFLDKEKNYDIYVIIIIFCASFAIPLYTLAGVRYGTGTFFFVWGIAMNLRKEWVKSLFLLFAACLTHFMFMFPIVLFLLYRVSFRENNFFKTLCYGIYVISFFLPHIISSYLNNLLPFFDNSLAEHASLYNNPDAIENISNMYFVEKSLFVRLRDDLVYWFCFIGILLLRTGIFKLSFPKKTEKLFYWVLLFMALANFSSSIPDLGIRLKFISFLFFFYYLSQLYNANRDNPALKSFIVIALLVNLLKIIIELRIIIEYTTLNLLIGNIYYILTDTSQTSVWTLLKNR